MIEVSRGYKRNTQAETLEVDGEWVILHTAKYTVTRLNEVGGLCWELLQQHRTVQELTEEVMKSYDITAQEAERDIEGFIEELRRMDLVEHAD
ncbi:PqqD family protein [Paenibacillus sp. GD4]|jgi:hypothetical protein|uniref:PqqD family protein n=1 Tax=Paenibacillus sp. GD4 TaxID=3068890 RepID=UPI00279640DD|nr:PqqD family protein [Paenibacillus sp. GD4]MDQ1910418.1 PqqD family protein [Paenibacillus sp. GD4]